MSDKQMSGEVREINYLEGKNLIIGVLAITVLAMIGYFILTTNLMSNVSKDKAVKNALAYINDTMLNGSGATAELSGQAEADKSLYHFYKFKIKIAGREVPSYVYVTSDGKTLFPESYPLVQATTTSATATPISKSDKPLLEAFIVSQCPFGLQMQRILNEVARGASDLKANIKVTYIGSVSDGKIQSMHGDQEAQENLKQICIREEQGVRFLPYLACYMKKGDTAGCLITTGVNSSQLNSCLIDPNKGLKYAQADFSAANNYGVSGSPTLILNGAKANEFDFGGRTAQAVKNLICSGFSAPPAACSQQLSSDSAAIGFSETYVGPAGAAASSNNTNCAPATPQQ